MTFSSLAAGAVCCLAYASLAAGYDAVCKSAAAVSADLAAHRATSQALVADYQARIARLNSDIHAIIAMSPRAAAEARLLALAYAYEQVSHVSLPPTFAADVLHPGHVAACP